MKTITSNKLNEKHSTEGSEKINGVQVSRHKKPVPFLKVEHFTGEEILNDDKKETDIYREMFLKSILDQLKEYPPPVPVINLIQGDRTISFLTLKSISLWQGKQKSKKTTALALAVAAFISVQECGLGHTYFQRAMDGVCLFFDTEQGESYAARTMKLILKIAGVASSFRLIYCDLRGYTPSERMKIIKAAIESTPDVKLVIVDGLVDLLNDFMEAREGQAAVTSLAALTSTYNIHIAVVLHQNKADKNARAHVGTISSQKCEMEIMTEVDPKDRAQSLVTCLNSRDLPFDPFAIRWDRGSLPCIAQEWAETEAAVKDEAKLHRLWVLCNAVYSSTGITQTEAVEAMKEVTGQSESTAKRIISDLKLWRLVTKNTDGKYVKNIAEGSTVQKGSNDGSLNRSVHGSSIPL